MEDLLYVEEAAKKLRVTRKTLYDWMRDGKLAFVTVGGRRRIPVSALEALIQPGVAPKLPEDDKISGNRIPTLSGALQAY